MPDAPARVVWSLASSGIGTTISAAGNSGGYLASSATNTFAQNIRTPVDLRYVDDIWLSASASSGAGTNLKVQLNFFDDQGNLFQFVTGTTPLVGLTLASAPGQAIAFAGKHGGGGSGTYVVPSEWGQVAWTITGSMAGVEICLYGR